MQHRSGCLYTAMRGDRQSVQSSHPDNVNSFSNDCKLRWKSLTLSLHTISCANLLKNPDKTQCASALDLQKTLVPDVGYLYSVLHVRTSHTHTHTHTHTHAHGTDSESSSECSSHGATRGMQTACSGGPQLFLN